MINKIIIEDLRIYSYHGVLPQERKVGAYFTINVELETDFSKAMQSDELDGTVSYANVFGIIKREMAVPSMLLEHVTGRIVKSLFKELPAVTAISIRMMKENPPMGADLKGAGIEVHIQRDEA